MLANPAPAHALDALALAAKHDPRAAEELLRRLRGRLQPVVSTIVKGIACGVLTEPDIEDIMQEVLLAIWQSDVKRYDPSKAAFMTFVSRRLRWHIVDALRAHARHEADPMTPEIAESVVEEGSDPHDRLASVVRERVVQELSQHLDRALHDDEDARRAVRRCDLEGATLAEVAKEIGRHTASAWRARQRGLRLLARRMEALAA